MNKIFALVTLLICIISGCETIREKTSGPEFEDTKLTAIIKAQLAREDTARCAGDHGQCRQRRCQAQGHCEFPGKKSESRRNHAQGKRREGCGQQPGSKALILSLASFFSQNGPWRNSRWCIVGREFPIIGSRRVQFELPWLPLRPVPYNRRCPV